MRFELVKRTPGSDRDVAGHERIDRDATSATLHGIARVRARFADGARQAARNGRSTRRRPATPARRRPAIAAAYGRAAAAPTNAP
jgi:hypothetical protein